MDSRSSHTYIWGDWMEKKISIREWIGFLFVLVIGSLSHFFYQWSGDNRVVGFFSPVNESTWEHLKLLFFPMLAVIIVSCLAYGRRMPGLLFAQAVGVLAGMLAIVVFFYTYSGILGRHLLLLDIADFVIGVAVAFGVSHALLKKRQWSTTWDFVGLLLLLLLLAAFLVFTVFPPQIGLFLDPVSGSYGM